VSGRTLSLGIAGCLQYNEQSQHPLVLYVGLASAAGLLLLLLLLIVLLYKVIRRNRFTDRRPSSIQQSPASSIHSRITRPNINGNSLHDMTSISVDENEAGYSKHLSIASDDDADGYLVPNPALDFL